jgi:hypothetical protein
MTSKPQDAGPQAMTSIQLYEFANRLDAAIFERHVAWGAGGNDRCEQSNFTECEAVPCKRDRELCETVLGPKYWNKESSVIGTLPKTAAPAVAGAAPEVENDHPLWDAAMKEAEQRAQAGAAPDSSLEDATRCKKSTE